MSVVLYSKSTCPFCIKAKRLLQSKGITFTEIDLEQEPPETTKALIERTNYRKVPQIFINEEFIGGFSELQTKNVAGELDNL